MLLDQAQRDRDAVVARVLELSVLEIVERAPVGLPRAVAEVVEADEAAAGRMQEAAAHADGPQARERRPLRVEELEHEAHPARDAPTARAAAVVVAQLLLVEVQRAVEPLADRQLHRERAGIDGQHEAGPAGPKVEGR